MLFPPSVTFSPPASKVQKNLCSSLFPMRYARWYMAGAFVEKLLSKYFLISLGVVRSLP